MENLISVVVPVYNVENYIDDCLQSLLQQSYKNIEILCVDDCGNDNSMSIVEKYKQKDDRIKILKHKKNLGLGGARNTGIDNANGKYIYFLDSDDFIDKDYLEKLIETIKKYDVDMVCNGKILKYYGNDSKTNHLLKKEGDFVLNKVMDFDNETVKKIITSVWCKLYKTDFLKNSNFYFPEKLAFEDMAFLHLIKTKMKNIVYIFGPTYYYRQRESSIMGQYKKVADKLDSIYIIKYIYEFYKKNNLLDKYSIPFAWLKKFFKRQKNKQNYFNILKDEFLAMREDVFKNVNMYSKKDLIFFNSVINYKNYFIFKIFYTVRRILKI